MSTLLSKSTLDLTFAYSFLQPPSTDFYKATGSLCADIDIRDRIVSSPKLGSGDVLSDSGVCEIRGFI